MRVLDLFSGIGGFSLGLERAGMETVAFCEIDPWCRKVLRKHWPDVPIYDDVIDLWGDDVGPVDVICGGYPCQPFSVAGERRGAEDDRHLWPEMHRLVDELRPTWVIGENVAGHITMGLDDVLSDLEASGYTARTFVIPACAVDAPHRRDRCWVIGRNVAHADQSRSQGRDGEELRKRAGECAFGQGGTYGQRTEWLPEPAFRGTFDGLSQGMDGGGLDASQGLGEEPQAINEASMRTLFRNGKSSSASQRPRPDEQLVRELADALCELPYEMALAERQDATAIASRYMYSLRQACIQVGAMQHTSNATEALWLSLPCQDTREWARVAAYRGPFHHEWPDTPRVATGIPRRVDRLRGLGNAVVPQVVERIGRAILDA